MAVVEKTRFIEQTGGDSECPNHCLHTLFLGSLGHSLYSPEQHCSWDDPHFENHFVTAFGHCAGEASPNNALGICNFEDQNCEDEAAEEPHLGMPPFMPYGRRGPDWLLPGGNWRANFRPRGVANDHGSAS